MGSCAERGCCPAGEGEEEGGAPDNGLRSPRRVEIFPAILFIAGAPAWATSSRFLPRFFREADTALFFPAAIGVGTPCSPVFLSVSLKARCFATAGWSASMSGDRRTIPGAFPDSHGQR